MTTLRHKIRMSIAATVFLFLLGGIVLGSSITWFDTRLRVEPVPKSMAVVEQIDDVKGFDSTLWFIMMLLSASVGLPIGLYILSTLNDCQELAEKFRNT